MKKIAVLTLSNSINYGGILQAVALNCKLKQIGYDPVYIQHQKRVKRWLSAKEYVQNRVKLYGNKGFKTKLRIIGGVCKTWMSNIYIIDRSRKIKNFVAFISDNLKTTDYYPTMKELEENCSDFDIYIVGSDQVWNNAFTNNCFDRAYFLAFTKKNVLKFSYAASAGGKKTDEYVLEIIENIKEFKGVSVREESLETHMKSLGCENVVSVLDPTLLLTQAEWISLEKKPKMKLPKHYILVYYLEKTSYNDDVIKTIADNLNIPVININPDRKKANYDCVYDYTAGPGEFIYYFHNADYVITNSFHATVFSMIFNKKFVAVPRKGQESRVEDLLKLVDMENRIIKKAADWKVIKSNIVIDSYNLLEEKRKSSVEFLKKMGAKNEV